VKIANKLPQNSKQWLAWRKSGLGASDAPIIMGVSPFTSRFELWLEKTGIGERPDFHPMAIKAMARGTLLEPKARECYEKKVGGNRFEPLNVIHSKYDFIRASLDGYNAEYNRIVEIKCPGIKDLEEARMGRVPKKYYPQVQLQLMLTGAIACDYFTYDGEDGLIVEVLPDKIYQEKLEEEMLIFWGLVLQKEVPELTASDVEKASKQVTLAQEKLDKAFKVHMVALEAYKIQGTGGVPYSYKGETNDQLGKTRKRSSQKHG
jgi:putative phage-type endonuclease